MSWQKIDSAPKDGKFVDIWAKAWVARTDRFEFQRFTGCWWKQDYGLSQWIGVREGWHPTHWMPVPASPDEEKEIV